MDAALQHVILGDTTPSDLRLVPGLEAWYSTKDPADITTATGVQLWRDRSGKSNETLLACDGTARTTSTISAIGTGDATLAIRARIPSTNPSAAITLLYIASAATAWNANEVAIGIETTGVLSVFKRGAGVGDYRYALVTSNAVTTWGGTDAYIAVTRSGTTLTIYVNGASVAFTETTAGTPPTWATTWDGTNLILAGFGNQNWFAGTLQRPAIWNRALSQAEITALVAAGGVPVAGDYYGAGIGTAINAGSFVVGKRYRIASAGTTDFTLIGAANSSVGTEFIATGVGTGNGTATAIGLLAYWDFSAATRGAATVTDTSGNSCVLTASTGARISGARDYFQGAATNQPAYDSATQTITADGVDNYLKTAPFPLVQPIWICGVVQQVTWTDTDALFDGFAAASGSVIQSTTTPQINLTAGSSVAANTGLAVGTTAILTAVISGADSLLQINAGQPTTGNTGAGNMNGLTLFASGTPALYANALCKEYAVFSRKPSEADRLRVIRFFARRCNISLT